MTVFDQNIFSHYKYFTYSVIISLGLDPDPDWFRKISNRIDPDPYSAKYLDPYPDSVNTVPFRHTGVMIKYLRHTVSSVVDPDPSTCFWASRIRIRIYLSEVWLRIRLRMRILLSSSCKNSKKNLDSYYFATLFDFLSLKNDVNVPSKSIKQKKLC
jgi:hypothetical protein